MSKRRAPPSTTKAALEDDHLDAAAFAREMAGVVRLLPDPRGRVRAVPPVHRAPQTTPTFVHAVGHDDGFAAPGVDRREIRRLKGGDYAPEAEIDLHGVSAAEACAQVKRFLENSRHRRRRCVCIVHGRGLHSPASRSILRPHVREYLRSSASVMAYADAPRSGGGAVYVLLRK